MHALSPPGPPSTPPEAQRGGCDEEWAGRAVGGGERRVPVCSVGCCGRGESLLGGVEGSQDAVGSGTALQHIPGEGAQSSLPPTDSPRIHHGGA